MSNQFTMTVDALKDVLDIRQGKLMQSLTPHDVTTGQHYVVSVKSNAKYHNKTLPVNKVAIYNTSNNNPLGWFYVVEEGRPQVIQMGKQGTDVNKVYAFFIDITSQDNTGSAEVTFTPVNL